MHYVKAAAVVLVVMAVVTRIPTLRMLVMNQTA
jgi:hypothetical protein